MIGDLHTVALVGKDGTIDCSAARASTRRACSRRCWSDRGRAVRAWRPRSTRTLKQLYLPDTNVLLTRFLTPDGVARSDFMPVAADRRERDRR